MDYTYFDTAEQKYVESIEGLPQGGIDSPYLWNIYMHQFDIFIKNSVNAVLKEKNDTVRISKRSSKTPTIISPTRFMYLKDYNKIDNTTNELKSILKLTNKYETDTETITSTIKTDQRGKNKEKTPWILNEYPIHKYATDVNKLKKLKYKLIKRIRLLSNRKRKLPAQYSNKKYLRYVYTRYADDWIILTNAPVSILEDIKTKIANFLEEELSAQLSLPKTIITNMHKKPAHFLGFELKTTLSRKIKRNKQKIHKLQRRKGNKNNQPTDQDSRRRRKSHARYRTLKNKI